jgi:GWxTD domain-containing protein
MERLLVECLVRATLIAAGTGVVLSLARIRTPAALHAVWTSVVIAMLLLPLWTVWGPKASMPVPLQPQASFGVVTETLNTIVPPSRSQAGRSIPPSRQVAVAHTDFWIWRDLVFPVYGVVACVLLVRLAIGTLRTHRLLRRTTRSAGRLTSSACASPVTVGWIRPVVILPAAWLEWSASKLDAVLTHEQEHVRRRDPLVQWLALLNRAVFWFHPVAWWLERRLAGLAEQACDDAVLTRGHDPQEYSAYLLETARAVARASRVTLAGVFMPGGFLPQRIRRILDGVPTTRASRARMAWTVAACGTATALCAVATPVRAVSQRVANPSRLIVRPLQPRWIPPDSTLPQPTSLEWLDGDEWTFQVQSIITNEELSAYSELKTAPQRDAFIARFWADRDPTPGTLENEFRDEYMRRVQFASEHFGDSGQAGFGFDSDRGRVYLMFGPPDAIDAQATAADPYEIWRYDSIAEMGADVRVRFSLSRHGFCNFRITSSASHATVEGVAASDPVNEPVQHASVQIYPLGLTEISIPVDTARVVGARYELRNRKGIPVDEAQIGFLDRSSEGPLSQHVPSSWKYAGMACTHSLPADTYTLTTAVRLLAGDVYREAVTFDVP